MSRTPGLQQNLSLTEELEKLEQSITLTLQEIDSNFSKAHRIVTSSIIPTVEQYAEQSKEVWESSKFWKQFFESSANVSLSGYEEQPPLSESGFDNTIPDESIDTLGHTTLQDESETYDTPSSKYLDRVRAAGENDDDPDISSLSLSPSHSTPRARTANSHPHTRDQEQHSDSDGDPILAASSTKHSQTCEPHDEDSISIDSPIQVHETTPRTPNKGKQPRYQGKIETPKPATSTTPNFKPTASRKAENPTDPILHHVLDKTYRLQATPLGNSHKFTATSNVNRRGREGTSTPLASRYKYYDSPLSSPELEAPKLHPDIFHSPVARKNTHRRNQSKQPTPGISVQDSVPLLKANHISTGWDSDDNIDLDLDGEDTGVLGLSPPKTMQFHVPHSRLLKTPAKEASKRIVSDLIHTAGGTGLTDDYDDIRYDDDHSPTVIRRSGIDETF
ncbi:DASH complex subunit ask1 [Myotisia sp. PD_48]|nr:DASH complex subunit ask1 [Myotisia sp. PD_48]